MKVIGHMLLPVIVSVCGCASVMDYPKEWPKAENVVTGKCPDVSGTYVALSDPRQGSQICELKYPQAPCISLYDITDTYEFSSLDNGFVKIRQTENKLHLERWVMYGGQLKKEGKSKCVHYSCSAEGVVVTKTETVGGGIPPIGGGIIRTKKDIVLNKAVDGSLLANIKREDTGMMLLLVIPYPALESRNVWWRWKKAD